MKNRKGRKKNNSRKRKQKRWRKKAYQVCAYVFTSQNIYEQTASQIIQMMEDISQGMAMCVVMKTNMKKNKQTQKNNH